MISILECTSCKDKHFNGYQCTECAKEFGIASEQFKFCPSCGTQLGSWKDVKNAWNLKKNLPKEDGLDKKFRVYGAA